MVAYVAITGSTEGSEVASLAVVGQAEGSETVSLAVTRQKEGSRVDAVTSGGAEEVCAAQTHKMAVAITGSAEDSGRISRTTGLGTT